MKTILLKGSWEINAPRSAIYDIISDFENMPKNFPTVAHSLKIIRRNNNDLVIEAIAKSFGKRIPVIMETTLIPQRGYISNNTNNTFKATGHEELLLEDIAGGTRIDYRYEYDLSNANIILRVIAKPLFDWFSMWYWKRAFIDRIKIILNCK